MGVRVIVKHPDSVLREKAVRIKKINSNLIKLLDDMAQTMYDADGVGLAAPQVGVLKRVAVVDVSKVEDENGGNGPGLIELINPEIITKDGQQLGPEGCLSIPGLLGDVHRAKHIKVKALNRDGEEFEMEAEGFLARAIQHEIDHLNGVLFIDIAEKVYQPSEQQEAKEG